MATWRDDVVTGLNELGGIGSLSDIYTRLRLIRHRPHPDSFEAIIRRELESNSSDSEVFSGKHDLFYSVDGLGAGVWGLRSYIKATPIASDINEGERAPSRILSETYRVLRDTELARQIKLLHKNCCQLCGKAISLDGNNSYAEAHHIKPLGKPHNGPDIAGNILVLCPNHHVILDYGAIKLDLSKIVLHKNHQIENEYVDYHNKNIWKC